MELEAKKRNRLRRMEREELLSRLRRNRKDKHVLAELERRMRTTFCFRQKA